MKLICYLSNGYPSIQASLDMAQQYVAAGCDIIEVDFPGHDPYLESDFIATRMKHALEACCDYDAYMDGMAQLRTLNRKLGTRFPLDGPKTLNGLIVGQLGEIPDAGTVVDIAGQALEILQTQDRAIKVVRLRAPVGRDAGAPLQSRDAQASSDR